MNKKQLKILKVFCIELLLYEIIVLFFILYTGFNFYTGILTGIIFIGLVVFYGFYKEEEE